MGYFDYGLTTNIKRIINIGQEIILHIKQYARIV